MLLNNTVWSLSVLEGDDLLKLIKTVVANTAEAMDLPISWIAFDAQRRKRSMLAVVHPDGEDNKGIFGDVQAERITVTGKAYNFYHVSVKSAVTSLLERHPLPPVAQTATDPGNAPPDCTCSKILFSR